MAKILTALGLMSGTSLDGIDAALVEIEGPPHAPVLRTRAVQCTPHPPGLRERLLHLAEGAPMPVAEVSALHRDVALAFADAALALLDAAGVEATEVAVIGSHGQTVHHQPPLNGTPGHTLQLGHGAFIAARTGIATVSDFRSRDMAWNGQGAPLVPFFDHLLFTSPTVPRAVQNLGGIGNVTFLAAGATAASVLAFDTGPANLLIDGAMQTLFGLPYDADGTTARRGTVDETLLARWLAGEPYFALRPPKSTGREHFSYEYARRLCAEGAHLDPADLVATITELTVQSIARAYRDFLPAFPSEVYLCGGGARNRTLHERLAAALAPARVDSTAALGVDPDFKEAVAFAVLAWLRLAGEPTNLPTVSGARRAVVLGDVHPGG